MTRWTIANASRTSSTWAWSCGLRATSRTITVTSAAIVPPGAEQDLGDALELLGGRLVRVLDRAEPLEQLAEVLAEDGLEHLFLRREVVIEEPVRDPGLGRDVADPCAVVAASGEHAHSRVEDRASAFLPGRLNGQSTQPRIEVRSASVQALAGILVVDFTRYLPGAYASRELLRLGRGWCESKGPKEIRCADCVRLGRCAARRDRVCRLRLESGRGVRTRAGRAC